MIDINAEVYNILEGTGYDIVFHYPQRLGALPVVSFYTVSESGEMSADNVEMFRSGVIGVDIYANAPAQCGEIAASVGAALADNGWGHIMSTDVPEETDGVFHRAMRYTKSFFVQ